MDKIKPTLILLSCLIFFLLSGCKGDISPPVLARHEARYPDIRKKYLYQSVIRIANTQGDPAFNNLIKDIRKIIIYLPPRKDSTYQVKDVSSGMPADGFEELIDVRTADTTHISLWVNESKAVPHFIGILDRHHEDIIFEIDGQLNLKYISALRLADQGTLMDLIN